MNLKIQKIATVIANISANGTANQIPGSPINIGRIRIAATKNKNVLKNEIKAETNPFENAVNMDDANIFIPENKYDTENNKNPLFAISKIEVPVLTKTAVIGAASNIDSPNITSEAIITNLILMLNNFLISSLFLAP